MSRVAKLFELNRDGLNVLRSIEALAILAVPFVVLTALGDQQYLLSVIFGVLYVALSDPGGQYGDRLRPMAGVAIVGVLLTGLGFAIGDGPWGFVVLAVFAVTLICGLSLRFGMHTFAAALLVNIWFLIALGLSTIFDIGHTSTTAWSQMLAWLVGGALWIAFTFIHWLVRGRPARDSHFPEIPGDTSPIKLTRPVILFAVIRAVALSISVAIAFGLSLLYAYWMPLATLLAMKPSLKQSAFAAEQRLAGTIIGAALAAFFLLSIDNKHALDVVLVVFAAIAASIYGVNNALYCAALAAVVLLALDLPHPTNFADEGRRVLFTLIGVGIGVIVMLIADRIQKHTAPDAQATT